MTTKDISALVGSPPKRAYTSTRIYQRLLTFYPSFHENIFDFAIKDSRKCLGNVATGSIDNCSTTTDGSRMLAAANLQNYLDVLSHLTASLLHFRGKLFRSGLNDQNPDGDSDTDSDDEISSTSLGGKFICRVNFFRVYFFRQGFGLGGGGISIFSNSCMLS